MTKTRSPSNDSIELSALESLKELSPEDPHVFLRKIVTVFLTQTRADLSEMGEALEAGQWGTISSLAHKTKSGARSVGAWVVGEISDQLEHEMKLAPDAVQVRRRYDELKAAFAAAESRLLEMTSGA